MNKKIILLVLPFLLITHVLFSLTIYDIQHTEDPSGNSPYVDSVVTVQGIATVSQGVFAAREYYIQDGGGPWNGIMIYDTDTTRAIEEGDFIELTGTVSEYYGKTEIGYLDEVTVISKGNPLPPPSAVQTDVIDTSEAYEGVLIRCSDVVVTDANAGYGEWLINDGSGDCRVNDTAEYSYVPSLYDTILHVMGIVNYSYSDFKIEPRGDKDIILTLDGTGSGSIDPDSVPNGYHISEKVVVLASVDTLRSLSLTIPATWQWSGDSSDVDLTGSGNQNAVFYVSGTGIPSDPYVITLDSLSATETDSSIITINNLVSPDSVGSDTFLVKTAGWNGALAPIPEQPRVLILSSDGFGRVTVTPDEIVSDTASTLSLQFRNSFGVLNMIEIETPEGWEWTGNAGDITLTGDGFSGAQVSIEEDTLFNNYRILVDSAGLDNQNNGTVILRNLQPPDSLDFYEFSIKTAGPGGTLTLIADNPQVLVRRGDGTIPIIAVDRNDADGVPHLEGDYVKIKGVVTTAVEFGEQANIEDATGGVCVYGISDYMETGDTVTVSGTVYQYYGLTELSPSTFEQFHGKGNVPSPQILTCYDIVSDGLGGVEKYEGELVMVKGVTTTAPTFPSDDNIVISDSTGNCEVRIKAETELPGADTPDSAFDIIGIIGQYRYSSPFIGGYQLMPRGFQDIIKSGDGSGKVEAIPGFISATDTSFIEFIVSAGLDTIKKVGITLPLEWYWSGDSTDISLQGDGFTQASVESISGDGVTKPYKIVIKDGSVFGDANGIITIRNMSPEGKMGKCNFPMETASGGGFLKEIYKSPSVWSVFKISEVQETIDGGYSSIMEGDSVYVMGSVSGPSSTFSSGGTNSFYIQDETGGVNIYSGEGREFHLGEKLVISGVVTEYNGLTEISTYPEKINMLEGLSDVTPSLLSLNQGITELLEGRLVKVENAVVTTKTSIAGAGKNFQVYNGRTIIDIRVNDASGIDLSNIDVGSRLDITGIGGQYDSEAPYNSGYQLLPRFPGDIEILGQGDEKGKFNLFTYPNPFSPDLGEIVTIEVNSPNPDTDRLTLKIFDLKGRLVKEIFNDIPGGSSTYFWYGRDKNFKDVPVGIYIAHLELKKGNGNTKSINKPIIVGTQ
jgi:DNA/RNA endonuclease YhcR with UshA esterase domain